MTMTHIETIEVGSGGAAAVTFNSIPQTGKDIAILFSFRGEAGGSVSLKFNTSSSDFTSIRLLGTGSSASSASFTSGLMGHFSLPTYTADTFGNGELVISNYASSSHKSISTNTVSGNNGSATLMALFAGVWANTAAITSIELYNGSGDIAEYSTASLYIIS